MCECFSMSCLFQGQLINDDGAVMACYLLSLKVRMSLFTELGSFSNLNQTLTKRMCSLVKHYLLLTAGILFMSKAWWWNLCVIKTIAHVYMECLWDSLALPPFVPFYFCSYIMRPMESHSHTLIELCSISKKSLRTDLSIISINFVLEQRTELNDTLKRASLSNYTFHLIVHLLCEIFLNRRMRSRFALWLN